MTDISKIIHRLLSVREALIQGKRVARASMDAFTERELNRAIDEVDNIRRELKKVEKP